MRVVMAVLLATLVVSLATDGNGTDLLRTTQGTLAPPTPEQWQQLLENRQSQNACLQKSRIFARNYKAAQIEALTEPTANQFNYDVRFYKLNLSLDFGGHTISGYCESVIQSSVAALNLVEFNFSNSLSVSSVTLNSAPVTFSHSAEILSINLGQSFSSGQQFTLRVNYSGPPGTEGDHGMFFYSYGGNQVCYTNCEPFGARLWWPCKDFPFDKPDSLDLTITHPSTMTLVSNGLQKSSVDNGNGTKTTRWFERYPIATYLVQLGCTNYSKTSQNWQYQPGQFMPVDQYYYPGTSPSNPNYTTYYMVNYTIPSLEAISFWLTLYPFVLEKYGHNNYGWGGAMEHQTLTSISPNFPAEYVIAHELTHQWAGDKVTCENFHHIWLNEGFASYGEDLYFKYQYGDGYYKSWLNSQKQLHSGSPYVEDLVNDDIFDGATVYDKAAWVVYMLHMIMGDTKFKQAMDIYFNQPDRAFASATTSDLSEVCSQVYGSDLSWFFNAWVYQSGTPDYEYSYQYVPNKSGYLVSYFIEQKQAGAVFPMLIDVTFQAGAWDTAFTVFNQYRGQLYQLQTPNPPTAMSLDPDEKILRTVTFNPSFTMHIVVNKDVDTTDLNQPYYLEFPVVGGVPPYTWQKISGQYPYGTTFHSAEPAYLDGTPNWPATFVFTLVVTDSDSPAKKDTQVYKVTVVEPPQPQMRGDANADGHINVADAVYIINYVFVPGSPPPSPMEAGDVNCDTRVNVADATYLINWVFVPGAPPPCNF